MQSWWDQSKIRTYRVSFIDCTGYLLDGGFYSPVKESVLEYKPLKIEIGRKGGMQTYFQHFTKFKTTHRPCPNQKYPALRPSLS
jgi:hypothetical protein